MYACCRKIYLKKLKCHIKNGLHSGLTLLLPWSAIKFVLSDIKYFHPHVKKMARTTLASLQVNSDVVIYNPEISYTALWVVPLIQRCIIYG